MSCQHFFLIKMHKLYTLTLLFSIIPCTAMSNVVYHIKKLQTIMINKKQAWLPGQF